MSIGTGVVVTITLQQVDRTPDAKTGTESHDKGLKNGNCRVKKCHSNILLVVSEMNQTGKVWKYSPPLETSVHKVRKNGH